MPPGMSVISHYNTPTCDVRSGTFSEPFVMANHTHTWWYNMSPLRSIIFQFQSNVVQCLMFGFNLLIHAFHLNLGTSLHMPFPCSPPQNT